MKLTTTISVNLLLLFFTGLFLGAIKATPPTEATLLGLSINGSKSEIAIQVMGNGCTVKANFYIEVKDSIITVWRIRPDPCKGMPKPVTFTYSFKEAGLIIHGAYVVKNKFIARYTFEEVKLQ